MFVPLVPYHAGGGAASFAPTDVHATEYEWALAQYFGFGVLPCWRGPRLYDSPATQRLVAKWVSFYKTHRAHVEHTAHLAGGHPWLTWPIGQERPTPGAAVGLTLPLQVPPGGRSEHRPGFST